MNTARVLVENPTPEEFHATRRELITATDIGAILGLNKYKSAYAVALEKKGLLPAQEDNDAMWLGRQTEPIILAAFERKMGRKARPNRSILASAENPWMGCTPDGYTFDPEEGLEAKLVGYGNSKLWGEPGTEDVPAMYWTQCQWSMGVTGLDRWWLIGMLGTKVQVHPLERDQATIYKMQQAAKEFREKYLLTDAMPDPTSADVDTVTSLYPISTDEEIAETPEIRALAELLAEARIDKAIAEKAEKDARAKLEALMQEKAKIKGSDFSISWKQAKGKSVVDYEEVVVEAVSKLPTKYSIEIQKMIPRFTKQIPGSRIFRPTGDLFKKDED